MRKQAAKIFATLSLFIVLTCVSAYGRAPYQIQVNVPFDFIVGDQTFPAGDYIIENYGFYTQALVIRSQDNRTATTVLSMPVRVSSAQAATKLVFHRNGDRYFLTQVWRAGDTEGRELLKSKLYREVINSPSQREVRTIG
jgi:hypothetical protein